MEYCIYFLVQDLSGSAYFIDFFIYFICRRSYAREGSVGYLLQSLKSISLDEDNPKRKGNFSSCEISHAVETDESTADNCQCSYLSIKSNTDDKSEVQKDDYQDENDSCLINAIDKSDAPEKYDDEKYTERLPQEVPETSCNCTVLNKLTDIENLRSNLENENPIVGAKLGEIMSSSEASCDSDNGSPIREIKHASSPRHVSKNSLKRV